MISRGYCEMLARYNHWQNRQLEPLLETLPAEELTVDRQAFFGSILETISHLCWGDHLWLSRFDGGSAPDVPPAEHRFYVRTLPEWKAMRAELDQRISDWAGGITDDVLAGELTWYSGMNQCDMSTPMGQAVVHFFNHQTHHRGQVHAMLTAAGSAAPVSDMAFMPEDV